MQDNRDSGGSNNRDAGKWIWHRMSMMVECPTWNNGYDRSSNGSIPISFGGVTIKVAVRPEYQMQYHGSRNVVLTGGTDSILQCW